MALSVEQKETKLTKLLPVLPSPVKQELEGVSQPWFYYQSWEKTFTDEQTASLPGKGIDIVFVHGEFDSLSSFALVVGLSHSSSFLLTLHLLLSVTVRRSRRLRRTLVQTSSRLQPP